MRPSSFWLQAIGWEQFPGLVHGFSGRWWGHGPLPGLGQEGLPLQMVKQVHGDEIVVVSPRLIWNHQPEADGMMTAETGVLLGITTADCVPVLMIEPERGIVIALHAGWRGTLKGISVRAIEKLKARWEVDPERLWVALGPAIDGCCYEVGKEVGEALVHLWGKRRTSASAWRPHGERGLLDLRAMNRTQCESAGVPPAQIQRVGVCTYCEPVVFASYRREGASAGRQLSVIGRRNLTRN